MLSIDEARVVFPLPDSPTIPKISPLCSLKLTDLSASFILSPVYATLKLLTLSKDSIILGIIGTLFS